MAHAKIRYREAEDNLPKVCMRCGGRATCRVAKTIRLYDTASGYGRSVLAPLFLVIDLLNYFNSSTLTLRGPFCEHHRHHWAVRRFLVWAFVAILPMALLFVVVLSILGAITSQVAGALAFASLFVGILVPAIIYATSIIKSSSDNDREVLVLANVHARFVEALEEQRRQQAPKKSPRPEQAAPPESDEPLEVIGEKAPPGHVDDPFADLDDAPDDRPRARRARASNPNQAATVLVAVIGAPLVLFVLLALIIRIGMLAEALFNRPDRPAVQNRNEKPRDENRDVEPGSVVPKSPPLPPLAADLDGKPSIDLIPLAVPRKDTVHGRWLVANKALHCNDASFVPRMQFPYRPPAEYDLVVTFWQQELRNGISLIMPNPNGGSFFWYLGNDDGAGYGFHGNPMREGRQPALIKAKTVHTTVVQVRKASVRAFVDGKELMRLQTNFRDLDCDDWRRIHNTEFIAVACDDPTVFYYVRLIEVTGQGKKGR